MDFSQIMSIDDKLGRALLLTLLHTDYEYLSFSQIREKLNAGKRKPYADSVIESTIHFYVAIGYLKEKSINHISVYAANVFPYTLKIHTQSHFKAFFRPFSSSLERLFDNGGYGENCFRLYHAARLCIENPALLDDIDRLYEELAVWAKSDPETLQAQISLTIANAWRVYHLREYARHHPLFKYRILCPFRFPELLQSPCPIDPPEYFKRIVRLYHSPVNASCAKRKLWQSSNIVEISRYRYSGKRTITLEEVPAFVDLCFGRENKRACKMFLSAVYAALFVPQCLECPECFYVSAYWFYASINKRRLIRFLNHAWDRFLQLSGKPLTPCPFDPITFCARALDVLCLARQSFETAVDVCETLLSKK